MFCTLYAFHPDGKLPEALLSYTLVHLTVGNISYARTHAVRAWGRDDADDRFLLELLQSDLKLSVRSRPARCWVGNLLNEAKAKAPDTESALRERIVSSKPTDYPPDASECLRCSAVHHCPTGRVRKNSDPAERFNHVPWIAQHVSRYHIVDNLVKQTVGCDLKAVARRLRRQGPCCPICGNTLDGSLVLDLPDGGLSYTALHKGCKDVVEYMRKLKCLDAVLAYVKGGRDA